MTQVIYSVCIRTRDAHHAHTFPGIKRFERIEYAFNLLNVLRQSQIPFSKKYNPSSGGAADNDYYFPNGIAKTIYSGWIEVDIMSISDVVLVSITALLMTG